MEQVMGFEGFSDVSQVLKAGVYLLCQKDVVVYVGQSRSLYQRIYSHKHAFQKWRKAQALRRGVGSSAPTGIMKFDSVHIMPCEYSELDRLERELIAKYAPKYNQVHRPKIVEPLKLRINGYDIMVGATPPTAKFERRI